MEQVWVCTEKKMGLQLAKYELILVDFFSISYNKWGQKLFQLYSMYVQFASTKNDKNKKQDNIDHLYFKVHSHSLQGQRTHLHRNVLTGILKQKQL